MRTLTLFVLIAASITVNADAQTATAPVTRADVAVSVGLFSADRAPDTCCWTSGFSKGLSAGFYWTDHLKTEMEIGSPGQTDGDTYSFESLPRGNFRITDEEHSYTGSKFSIAQTYQFGRNAMFHPYVTGGLDIDREHDSILRTISTSTPAPDVSSREERTTFRTRPFAGVGFKTYFSERTFFTAGLKIGGRHSVDQLTWKAGIGIDLGPRRSVAARPIAPGDTRHAVRAPESPGFWRDYATRLGAGALVDVKLAGGKSLTAEIVALDEEGLTVKPRTRVAEASVRVPYDVLEQMALHTGASPAARIGGIALGAGTGYGVMWALFLVTLAHFSD